MVRQSFLLSAAFVLLLVTACSPQPQPEPSQPEYRPTATVKDLMDSIVDPSADVVWDSVQSIATLEGLEEKAPHTDEEWEEVRHGAIRLVEATNLLLMPGRHIAKPGEKAENPEVELHPEEIEAKVNGDRATWTKLVHGVHDKASEALQAIDARDATALRAAGDQLDAACERCHLTYWYPKDEETKAGFEENEKMFAKQK